MRDTDVLIENYKVGDLARYGLDYERLSRSNPQLIYCSITGFGQTGPYAKRPGYDAAFQGMSGMMAVTGDPEGEPQRVGVFIIDEMTGLYASVAILAALRHRDAGGGGQYIDLALLDVGVAAMAARTVEWTLEGKIPERLGHQVARFGTRAGVQVRGRLSQYPGWCGAGLSQALRCARPARTQGRSSIRCAQRSRAESARVDSASGANDQPAHSRELGED